MGWSMVGGDHVVEESSLGSCSTAYRKVGMMGTGEHEKGNDVNSVPEFGVIVVRFSLKDNQGSSPYFPIKI